MKNRIRQAQIFFILNTFYADFIKKIVTAER